MRTRERLPNHRLPRGRRGLYQLAVAAVLLGFASVPVHAQDNDTCFDCHSDPELTGSFRGVDMSMFVGKQAYAASVHAKIACVDCHRDLDPKRRRHSTRRDLEPAVCDSCHESEVTAHNRSLHGAATDRGDPMAPGCADCHGKHDILPASDPDAPTAVMNVPMLCGSCHREGAPVSRTHEISQDRILENYSMSIHGEGLFRQGLIVTAVCTSCHTAHDILSHTDTRSSIHVNNVAETCASCHVQIERVHRKVIEGR